MSDFFLHSGLEINLQILQVKCLSWRRARVEIRSLSGLFFNSCWEFIYKCGIFQIAGFPGKKYDVAQMLMVNIGV